MSGRPHKWRDVAWKEVLCDGAQSAIEYLMPDLAADMDPEREMAGIPGMELFADRADSDKDMRELDVFSIFPRWTEKMGTWRCLPNNSTSLTRVLRGKYLRRTSAFGTDGV